MPLPINPDPGFVIQDLPPVSASIVRSIPRSLSLMRTWMPSCGAFGTVGALQTTVSVQWGLEAGFDMVRLIYSNDTATPYTVMRAAVSPSSAIGDGHSPVNAAGANDFTMFSTVYFNNAGLDVSPQDQTTWGSGTTTLPVPANPGTASQPIRRFSDWTPMLSLDRTDGGTNPLLMSRTLTDATGTYRYALAANGTWAPVANGRTIMAYQKTSVDSVTVPALLAAPGQSGVRAPDGIQYISRVPGFSVLGVGDSLTSGGGSSATNNSWGWTASAALSTPARPITFWNEGWVGQVTSDFFPNGYVAFKACKPDVVTIAVWSPNDGLTQAAADAGWSRAMAFCDYVMRQGAVPVLMGPCPWQLITTVPQDAARLSTRTRMLQAQAYGVNVLDWEPVLGTGASPNRIQPALLNVNHPNDAGNALMDSAVFRPVLANILRA
ncbi:MAG TPA: SGNH/GDSL hydrolase family protein [Acetobacteraceae bacterium]|jgi:hypothetical protein|nr:SGNH/GDSL hydrolase family protein [Acetobacteraceae bacterium]